MHMIGPALATAFVALCAWAQMMHAGVARRQLASRPERPNREMSV
jgi:hypothetical protein